MNIKKYFTFHSNISEYAMYFKYSLIVALIIYNFLYLLSIETTDITGAPAGIFIIFFEIFMALFLLVPTDIIAMALIFFSISGFNLIEQTIKDFIVRIIIYILLIMTCHYVLYLLFQAIDEHMI